MMGALILLIISHLFRLPFANLHRPRPLPLALAAVRPYLGRFHPVSLIPQT